MANNESKSDGYKYAMSLIANEKEEKTGFLYLGYLGLESIPDELFDLEHLEDLSLGNLHLDIDNELHEFAKYDDEELYERSKSFRPNTIECLEGRWDKLKQLKRLQLMELPLSAWSAISGLCELQTLHLSGDEILSLDNLKNLSSLIYVECVGTKLTSLVPFSDLTSLKKLVICGNQFTSLEPISKMENLLYLKIEDEQITDLGPIAHLKNLETLKMMDTSVSSLRPISKLINLQQVECNFAKITDLQPLTELQGITSFKCCGNKIKSLAPLACLPALRSVNFSFTNVTSIEPLSELSELERIDCLETNLLSWETLADIKKLRMLDCSNTNIADLKPLENLLELQSLKCYATKITDLEPLSNLTYLQSLICPQTRIASLNPLSRMDHLTKLNCSHTEIESIEPISKLNKLTELDCSYTKIDRLDPLVSLPKLKFLSVNGCKLSGLPQALIWKRTLEELHCEQTLIRGLQQELLSQTWHDNCLPRLQAHFRDLEKGSAKVSDAKLILLGNGRVGKTQICRRLQGSGFDESVPSTHGIMVSSVEKSAWPEKPMLNLWDFGGQDIYHGTHSLFTRTRAVFVIVWNPESENTREYVHEGITFRNNQLDYWLAYVRHLGGPDSAVILVQSKCDSARDEQPAFPVVAERTDFPFFVHRHVSAATDRGLTGLEEALKEAIEFIRQRDGVASIGKGRDRVIQQLRTWHCEDGMRPASDRRHRILTLDEFKQLCGDDVSSPDCLLDYLHNIGVVFYRERFFKNTIILDQTWALDAVYALFDRQSAYPVMLQLGGRFTRRVLGSVVWGQYTEAEQNLFIELMQACGICFCVKKGNPQLGIDAEYIAPDLLPERANIEDALRQRQWKPSGADIEIRFHYAFLHSGMMRSIISRIGDKAVDAGVYWRTGVWVYEQHSGAAAVIEQQKTDERKGTIEIRVQGKSGEKLAKTLAKIVQGADTWQTEIQTDVVVDSQKLDDAQAKSFLNESTSESSREKHAEPGCEPKTLIEDAHPLEKTAFAVPPKSADAKAEVYISYAWGDKTPEGIHRQALVDSLCDSLIGKGFDIEIDKECLKPGDRISYFMKRLSEGDRIIVVLSDSYVRSPNCMYELFSIYRNHGQAPERFLQHIIPLVLPDAKIGRLPDRLKYAAFWKKEHDEIHGLLHELDVTHFGIQTMNDYKHIQAFSQHVADILAYVNDTLFPRDFERQAKEGFSEIVENITTSVKK